jgi:hypothetical protein
MVMGSFVIGLLGWHCVVSRVDADILEEFTVFSLFRLSVMWRDVCWTMTQDLEKSNHSLTDWWYLTAKAPENTKPVGLASLQTKISPCTSWIRVLNVTPTPTWSPGFKKWYRGVRWVVWYQAKEDSKICRKWHSTTGRLVGILAHIRPKNTEDNW